MNLATIGVVHALLVGFGLGFLVALQLGPMSLFLIRSTLRAGWAVGLAIGAGIALVDALYAAAGAAGAAPLLTIGPLRGGPRRWPAPGSSSSSGPARCTRRSACAAGSSCHEVAEAAPCIPHLARRRRRPTRGTIASWAAIFAAASVAGAADRRARWRLVPGVALGSLAWVTALASVAAVGRRAAGERAMRTADVIAGAGLVGFGGALAYGRCAPRTEPRRKRATAACLVASSTVRPAPPSAGSRRRSA